MAFRQTNQSSGFCVVVMGVSGSGKSTIGERLARALSGTFIDGDDLHPRANVMKMANGIPLTDEDRAPWLTRINDAVFSLEQRSRIGVVVCSALKRSYREAIRANNQAVFFLFLDGSKQVILQRIANREGHFMKPQMLASQFDILERPSSDEIDVMTVSLTRSPAEIVNSVLSMLSHKGLVL